MSYAPGFRVNFLFSHLSRRKFKKENLYEQWERWQREKNIGEIGKKKVYKKLGQNFLHKLGMVVAVMVAVYEFVALFINLQKLPTLCPMANKKVPLLDFPRT